MDDEASKRIRNIRTISRYAGIDDDKQVLYIRETLDFLQMLLLFMMTLFEAPDEIINKLADDAADAETIKTTFTQWLVEKNAKQQPEESTPADGIADEKLQELLTKMNEMKESQDKCIEQYQSMHMLVMQKLDQASDKNNTEHLALSESLKQYLQNLKKDREAEAAEQLKEKQALEMSLTGYDVRTYARFEKLEFEKLKNSLLELTVRRLKLILKALNAGVQPSQLLKYKKATDEQLELIIHILMTDAKGN